MADERALDRLWWSDQSDETPVEVCRRLHGLGRTLNQSAVAGLAVHMRVLAVLLYVQHVRVAALAGLVPGKFHRMRGNFADGRPAIVPILSKAFGHNVVACHQKHQEGEDKEPRKPEKMSCILKDTHQALSITPLPGGSREPIRM